MTLQIENILIEKKCVGVITRKNVKEDGLKFITDESMPLQLGIHSYKTKKESRVHGIAKISPIRIKKISKYIYVLSGTIVVEFYKSKDNLFKSYKIKRGDSILIFDVIHKVIFGKNSKAIEVKQGPYQYD